MADIILASGHTYEFILEQELHGQIIINRFTYVCETIGPGAVDAQTFLTAWVTYMLGAIEDVQVSTLLYKALRLRHLGGSEGTHEKLLTGGGMVTPTDGAAPSYLCASMRLYTDSGLTRSGWKRFAGLDKVHIDYNIYNYDNAPSLTTAWNALRVALEGSFEPVTGAIMQTCVWAKIPSPGSGYAGYAVDSATMPVLGTQNSRKPNYGD